MTDQNSSFKDGFKGFIVPVEILDFPDLDIYEQMVYIVLRSFANPREATAFPSYSTISKLGRMSLRKAKDAMNGLVEKGLISKESRFEVIKGTKKIRQTSNLYSLNTPGEALVHRGAQDARGVVHDVHGGSAQRARGVVHDVHGGSAQRARQEHNHLTKSIRTKSINNNQSINQENIPLPENIMSYINQNGLIDRLNQIYDCYSLYKNEKEYTDLILLEAISKTLSYKPDNFLAYLKKTVKEDIQNAQNRAKQNRSESPGRKVPELILEQRERQQRRENGELIEDEENEMSEEEYQEKLKQMERIKEMLQEMGIENKSIK